MTWPEFILFVLLAIPSAIVSGWLVGRAFARRATRNYEATTDQYRPDPFVPPTPRLVPIGGCTECDAAIDEFHTGYCSKSHVVTETDCRHLTAGDMGMG